MSETVDSPAKANEASDTVAEVLAKLMEDGGLAKTLKQMVEQQTALAVQKLQAAKAKNVREATVTVAKVTKPPDAARSDGGSCASCSAGASSTRHGRPQARATGEIIEAYDLDDKDCNVDRWVAKIDQLGRIHGWSDYEKSCHMQAKLRGAARAWFNRLDNYDLSWEEWKASLTQAFPRQHDFGTLLEELVARRKLPSETMTRYYHDKLGL